MCVRAVVFWSCTSGPLTIMWFVCVCAFCETGGGKTWARKNIWHCWDMITCCCCCCWAIVAIFRIILNQPLVNDKENNEYSNNSSPLVIPTGVKSSFLEKPIFYPWKLCYLHPFVWKMYLFISFNVQTNIQMVHLNNHSIFILCFVHEAVFSTYLLY